MMPILHFNPSIANLTALRGLPGMAHPIRPMGAPMPGAPVQMNPLPGVAPMLGTPPMPGGPMPGPMPVRTLPGMMNYQIPQNNLSNLQALQQLFSQGRQPLYG